MAICGAVEPIVRYVCVEGPVTRTVQETGSLLCEMSSRYLPSGEGRALYRNIEFAKAEPSDQVAIYLRPSTGCRRTWARSDSHHNPSRNSRIAQ